MVELQVTAPITQRTETAATAPASGAWSYATLTFCRGGLTALAVTLVAGVLAVLHYLPVTASALQALGIDFTTLRPVHTTFAVAWIFLGGLAVVHHYLQDAAGPPDRLTRTLLVTQVGLWMLAGAGVLLSLALEVFSGREYMGFHPVFSIPILLGWLCFAVNFFRGTAHGFFQRPVYVSMWGVGVLFFIYTFLEQHLWLLPGVFEQPVVDLRLQWKANGTLIGSFNLFVYGCLYYISERISGDRSYAHSRMAYALFAVGLINSFTNFAHHTYHVPQSAAVKWISFVISMAEIALLARVMWDLTRSRGRSGNFHSTRFFLSAAKWWTMAILFSSVLISIPPLNALIHGTHVVTGHAMGSTIGIDSMVLFAAVAFLLAEIRVRRGQGDAALHTPWMRTAALGFNVATAALVLWLTVSGMIVGYCRYLERPEPEWFLQSGPYIFAALGLASASFLAMLLAGWSRFVVAR